MDGFMDGWIYGWINGWLDEYQSGDCWNISSAKKTS